MHHKSVHTPKIHKKLTNYSIGWGFETQAFSKSRILCGERKLVYTSYIMFAIFVKSFNLWFSNLKLFSLNFYSRYKRSLKSSQWKSDQSRNQTKVIDIMRQCSTTELPGRYQNSHLPVRKAENIAYDEIFFFFSLVANSG